MYIKVRRLLSLVAVMLLCTALLAPVAYATDGGSFWDQIKGVGSGLWETTKEAAGTAKEKLPDAVDAVKNGVSQAQEATSSFLQDQQDQFWKHTEQQIFGSSGEQPTQPEPRLEDQEASDTTASAPTGQYQDPEAEAAQNSQSQQTETIQPGQDQHSEASTTIIDNHVDQYYDQRTYYYGTGGAEETLREQPDGTIIVDGQVYQKMEPAEPDVVTSNTTSYFGMEFPANEDGTLTWAGYHRLKGILIVSLLVTIIVCFVFFAVLDAYMKRD